MKGKNSTALKTRTKEGPKKSTKEKVLDSLFAFLLASFSLFMLVGSSKLIEKVRLDPGEIPPTFFPRIILSAMFLLSLFMILRSLLGRPIPKFDVDMSGIRRVATMTVAMFVYLFLFDKLGFITSSALFLVFMSWYFGCSSWTKIVALSVIFPPLLYLFFYSGFRIFLPRGLF